MLEIKDLWKSYKTKEVLRGVNLSVLTGEIKGLVGVNGAGKTTLIELVCRVKSADKGEIVINNISLSYKKVKNQLKKLIGYMPQSFSLYNDLTVEENLGYLSAVYGLEQTKVDEIINTCNLQDMKKRLARNLSGGYRQLLSLAGAIIHSPKFLILDEPTTAMDPIFRKNFWRIIHEFKKNGATILIITHYMEELLECDSFACLSNGRISFDGKTSELDTKGYIDFEKLVEKGSYEQN